MATFLNIIIFVQSMIGLVWVVPLLFHDGDFSSLYLLFLSVIVNAAFFLIACWVMWKYPLLRRRAGVVMGLPIILYFLPFAAKAVAGGPFTGERGVTTLIVIAVCVIGFILFFPRRAFGLLPRGLVQSRFLNWLIILIMIAAWLFPVATTAWLALSNSNSSSSTAVAYVIYYLAIYIVMVGAGALAVMLWGWIGVRGDADNPSRRLHIAQLVMGSPSLVFGVLTLVWLASQR